jgi:hypothetical protein
VVTLKYPYCSFVGLGSKGPLPLLGSRPMGDECYLKTALCHLEVRGTLRSRYQGTFLSAARRINNLPIFHNVRTLKAGNHSECSRALPHVIGRRVSGPLRSATACPEQGKETSSELPPCTLMQVTTLRRCDKNRRSTEQEGSSPNASTLRSEEGNERVAW